MRRSEIINRISRNLVEGRCCFLVGHKFMAKTPLVRQVAYKIATETSCHVQCVDFEQIKEESWEETCTRILKTVGLDEGQQPNNSLRDGLEYFIANNENIPRLVMLFDNLKYLAGEQLPELAYQCHAVYTEGKVNPYLSKISMLWSGDEDLLERNFGITDVFIRNTERYVVGCLTREEFDEMLDAEGHAVPLSEDVRNRLWELTGGHPNLTWIYKDCFMWRAFSALRESSKPLGDVEVLDEVVDKYIDDALDSLNLPSDLREPSFLAEIASRIENSAMLLDVIVDIRSKGGRIPFSDNIQHLIRRNEDLFVVDGDCVRIRSEIMGKFIHRYFDDKRLGDCYFVHYEDTGAWEKAIECYKRDKPKARRSKNQRVNTPTGKTLLELVEVASHRFHRLDTKEAILSSLVEIAHYVIGIPVCSVFEMEYGKPINKFSMPRSAQVIARQMLKDPLPYAMKATIATGNISTQGNSRQICIPILLEGRVRFLVWADTRRGEPLTTREMSLLVTLCKFAEGPIADIETQERNQRALAERERELVTFRQLTRVVPGEDDALDTVLENACKCLSSLGYRIQIRCRDLPTEEIRVAQSPILPTSTNHTQQLNVTTPIMNDGQIQAWSKRIPIRIRGEVIGEMLIETDDKHQIDQQSDFLEAFALDLEDHVAKSWESQLGHIYKYVFDNIGTGIQVIDGNYSVLALNKNLEDLLRERDGYTEPWFGKKCYRINRPSVWKARGPFSTLEKARKAKDTVSQIEHWPSPKFPSEKEIWHKVTSTPIFDKSGEMISAVETSWPVDVQDVFAEIAPQILSEKDADVVREKIVEGILMLGFDRARLYWFDPNSGLLTGKVWAGPGYGTPSKLSEQGIVFTRDVLAADALEPVLQWEISLIRRKSLNTNYLPKISDEDVHVFWLDPLPYEEQLQHQGVPELLIVPLVSASGIMGAIAADYKLSKQFITDSDIRRLRQYAWLAAQFIQGAEYGNHLADLLRRLSHQTLTPLQAIRFQLNVIRSGSEEEQESAYESVSQTIERLANTYSVHSRFVKLSSLSEYDELLRRTVSENLERVKVKSLFEEQKKLFEPLCRMEDIDFRIGNTKSNGHEVTINIHKDIFFEALTNIVQNAVDAIPPEWDRREIELRTSRNRKGAYIFVSDSGVGIPPELWQRVFEPFYPPKSRGSGIGLYVTKKNLEAHDFTVEFVVPLLGCGTTAKITIPKGGTHGSRSIRRR